MTQQRRRVTVIANRDREQIDELKSVLGGSGASVDERAVDRGLSAVALAARDADLVLLKLTTDGANRGVFRALRNARVRYLNSLRSVKLCQSRRATFAFANRRLPDVTTPRMFLTPDDAERAIARGHAVWVRRDAHNIPLDRRVLGIARSVAELRDLVGGEDARSLFFQEFLGSGHDTYKAYVVGTDIVVCRRTDAAVECVAMPSCVTQTILRFGPAFAMPVYGIDFFYHDGRAVCLDVNDFPSFRGIAQASRMIGEYVTRTFFGSGC
jgi:hypothetical protein